MPRPPNIDAIGKLNFITNYILHGCEPPSFLFIECAQEPAQDLLMLFLVPDFVDIGQAVFDPKAGRKRKPARHGRKKPGRRGFPDPSDVVGQRARGALNPHNALDFGPVNKAFRIWNKYEALAITVAVVEGVTDVGYSGLLGMLTIEPNRCEQFSRLVRRSNEPELGGAVGPPIWPIFAQVVEANQGFNSTTVTAMNQFQAFVIHLRMVVMNNSFEEYIECAAALGAVGGAIKGQSAVRTIAQGETVTLNCSADFEAFETCEWGLSERFGNALVISCEVVAFGKADIPWPL